MSNQKKPSVKDICRVAVDTTRSHREVGRLLGVSPTTIAKYRNLMKLHKVDRDRLQTLTNDEIEVLVQARYTGGSHTFAEPDWAVLATELQRKDVTVALLYQEFADALSQQSPDAPLMSQSSFGRRLRHASKKRRVSMRQTHKPGEKMFVDFSGKHLFLTERATHRRTPVEIFVASLGASQLLFATAVASQKLPDWIVANVRALEFYGGATKTIVPDNLKSAVTKAKQRRQAPLINRTYLDFAEHYGIFIDPARALHPQDKALAEIGVRMVNMWVIAALRNHVFYSLTEMNAEIARIIEKINGRKSRRLGASRRTLFERTEAACLSPLPAERYAVVEWQDGVLVPKDYHVPWRGDYYSVPHTLVGERVNIAASSSTLKAYTHSNLSPVAIHQIGTGNGANITDRAHMPEAHRLYAEDSPASLHEWAKTVGADVAILFNAIAENRRISPPSAIRQMSRAKKLAREYGQDRLTSACRYANAVGTQTIDSIQSILKHGLDLRDQERSSSIVAGPVDHENVRGAASYDGGQ